MRLINFETQRLINLEYQKLLQCQERSVQVNLFTIKPLFMKGFSENKKLVCILLRGLYMCDINYFLIIKDIFEVKSER